MKLFLNVLIAAVTVNCLVTTINGKAAIDTLAVPYIDTLLPPLKDVQDNNNREAATKINNPTKATAVRATTKATTKAAIAKNENNILPKLSLEALLPPLLEAKLDKGSTKTNTKTAATTATKAATTRRPTTTRRTTTPTTTRYSTTPTKPSYATTTTLKSGILKVPDLSLDPFLPPLTGNEITSDKATNPTTTTLKPTTTANKSYYQQQQVKYTPASTAATIAKNYKKPAANDRDVAETRSQTKQVPVTSQPNKVKLQREGAAVTQQYVAKQTFTNSQFNRKQLDYSFDVYLGSTTARPAKSGLPTITPFPHRLGR